jgi:prepilin-type N-terminal cleavage/methylation domain-containing protein
MVKLLDHRDTRGFTLIEMSIVLVVIGLIVGGILVGQDLIKGAAAQAQVSQIQKYNSAVNTFRNKYGGIPGDLQLLLASQFGFSGTGCGGGQLGGRDGNGLIDGWDTSQFLLAQFGGETNLFWSDITTAGLIEGQFPAPGAPYQITCGGNGSLTANQIGYYLPSAKIGNGNFVYVYETNAANWFGIEIMTGSNNGGQWPISAPGITVSQSYAIDKKVDDGMPTHGNVQATYIAPNNVLTIAPAPNTSTSGGNSTSCYDTTTNTYSTGQTTSNLNCALSFKFQ